MNIRPADPPGQVVSRPRLAPKRVFYGWVVVAVSLVGVVMTSGSRAAPGALLVDMERSTPWSTSSLSMAASISLLAYGLAGPLSAVAIARFGLRRTVTFSLIASSLSFVVSARA
jgi:cyanate permease